MKCAERISRRKTVRPWIFPNHARNINARSNYSFSDSNVKARVQNKARTGHILGSLTELGLFAAALHPPKQTSGYRSTRVYWSPCFTREGSLKHNSLLSKSAAEVKCNFLYVFRRSTSATLYMLHRYPVIIKRPLLFRDSVSPSLESSKSRRWQGNRNGQTKWARVFQYAARDSSVTLPGQFPAGILCSNPK